MRVKRIESSRHHSIPANTDENNWHVLDLQYALKIKPENRLPIPIMVTCYCTDGKHDMIRCNYEVDM